MAKKKETLTIWVKPSKVEVRLNDEPATVAAAEALGWKVSTPTKSAK